MARNTIQPAQKDLIRSRLVQGSVDEEDKSLAMHNALVIAKIVRIDYPNNWPNALPEFIALSRSLQHGNQQHLGGSLRILLRVVKELATARLAKSQKALQSTTPELVQLLGEVYTERTSYWMDFLVKGRGDEDDADLAMSNSLTALKILRRLVIVGYEQPAQDQMVQGFWSLSQTQFDQFLGSVSSESRVPAPFQDIVGKHLIQFTKLHIQMCDEQPLSFSLLPNSIPLVKAYWALVKDFSEVFEKSGGIKQTSTRVGQGSRFEGPLLERLALKGILLLRGCVSIAHKPVQTFKYRNQETKRLEDEAMETMKTGLLTKEFLMDVVQVIISKLFIFRKSDLEAWEEDPEEWEGKEKNEGSAWEWAVRPCSERLLVDLLTRYKDLGQPLLAYCQLATQVEMDVVTKEAAYCALGCAAQNVHEAFDFDRFLAGTLVKDVQLDDSMAKLLRRRVPILISQWISIKVARENRPTVYEIFRHLLNAADKHNDEVVRITAARQLKLVADDFEFVGEQFLPFAADIFSMLLNLLDEVNLDETKLAILETIRGIVQRMDTEVSQFGDAIMTMLPKLWSGVGAEEYMIKQAVLAITTALVQSMKADSQRYQSVMIPLLQEATNPDSPLHLHLIEETVELWSAMLAQSVPPLSSDLVQLVHLGLPLLEYDTDVAKKCLEIVQDYIVLAPESILSDSLRRPTLAAVAKTLEAKSRDQGRTGAVSIEYMLMSAERLGGSQGVGVLVQDMLEIGLLHGIMEDVRDARAAHVSFGPNKRSAKINSLRETDYFMLLSRIALADPTLFVTVLAGFSTGQAGASPSAEALRPVWSWLSAEWFGSMDATGNLERTKLFCLALTRLAELPVPLATALVLERHLQAYLAMWTSVVTDVRAEDEDELATDPNADALVWKQPAGTSEYDTPLDVRERELGERDPVHTVKTYAFVVERLADLVQRVGGEDVFQAEWAVNVDDHVLKGFQQLREGRARDDE